MPRPLSRDATIAVFVGVTVAVVTILASFVWPGFLVPTRCEQSSGPFKTIDGRTYCFSEVSRFHGYYEQTFWGFSFKLLAVSTPGGSGIQATVIEPNGTSDLGNLFCGPACDPETNANSWFTPDNEAGIVTNWTSGNTSLLVEK